MYLYKGRNPDNGKSIEKQFEDLYDAEEYANDNIHKYPNFTVTDLETNDVVYDTEMAYDSIDMDEDEYDFDDSRFESDFSLDDM